MSFPANFVWGAAASAYQIEGAAREDGRGLSVWDVFAHTPGKTWGGQHGDTACDHYHRYRADVTLMRAIGLKAYRLSVSWPRVIPRGVGQVNPAGLAFYDRLVDELLAASITPYVTLFHWDFPYDLYRKGGWLARDSADWFADYATAVVSRLGDRVQHWFTVNEPAVFMNLGHRDGTHAPGDTLSLAQFLLATHNAMRGHGKAVQAIRAASKGACQVGAAPDCRPAIPVSTAPADVEAARQAMFAVQPGNTWANAIWIDPLVHGRYPEQLFSLFADFMPDIPSGDMETIGQPLDFLGINIYTGNWVRAGADGQPEHVDFGVEQPRTFFEWPVLPEALYWGPRFLYDRYQLPIYITENGMTNLDWVSVDGKVHDPQRIDFLTRYLRCLRDACKDGADVRGYFHWSIMDNFEWAEGYKHRFGFIYVNYQTQERIFKDSAYWYRDVIATNGGSLG